MARRRVLEEYEADLYRVPKPRFFLFRVPKGELELKKYDDGEKRLEIKFVDVKVPDGSAASVVIDGRVVCQVEVNRRRGRLDLSTAMPTPTAPTTATAPTTPILVTSPSLSPTAISVSSANGGRISLVPTVNIPLVATASAEARVPRFQLEYIS